MQFMEAANERAVGPTLRPRRTLPEELAISVSGLRKQYGERAAVDGIDLDVRRGEIFALLGPNGAGKTTTVEILEGYRARSAGEVSVMGHDPAAATREWRDRIGIVLQFIAGVFVPYSELPPGVRVAAGIFPLKWIAQDFRSVFLPDAFLRTEPGGSWQHGQMALVLIGWSILGAIICARTFRWGAERSE